MKYQNILIINRHHHYYIPFRIIVCELDSYITLVLNIVYARIIYIFISLIHTDKIQSLNLLY